MFTMASSTIYTLDVDDEQLQEFHNILSLIDEQRMGAVDGVVMVRRRNFTPDLKHTKTLVERLLPEAGKYVTKQVLCHTNESGLYHTISEPAHKEEVVNFLAHLKKESSFNGKTCCLEKAKDGIENLLDHFFSEVMEKNAEHRISTTIKSNVKNRLKKVQAVAQSIKEEFDNLLAGKKFTPPKKSEESDGPPCRCLCCYDLDDVYSFENIPKRKIDIFYAPGVVLDENSPVWICKNFTLSRIINILQVLPFFYEGLSNSYFYIGRLHAFFPIHIEDCALWSINYLHFGAPKLWIIIPPSSLLQLQFHLSKSGAHLLDKCCKNVLGHKNLITTLSWLRQRHITFQIVVQNPGEFLVLHPNAAHFGWSLGWNLGEAINVGTISWIPIGANAAKCHCLPNQIHLDIDVLIGAFQPDILEKYLAGQYIHTSQEKEMVNNLLGAFPSQEKNMSCDVNKSITEETEKELLQNKEVKVVKEDAIIGFVSTHRLESKEERAISPLNHCGKKPHLCPAKFCQKSFPTVKRLECHICRHHISIMKKLLNMVGTGNPQ